MEFVDIAGLVRGASKGEGLGNKFLADIREVDAIVHVVRCFEDENIVHVDGNINSQRDIETINLEPVSYTHLDVYKRQICSRSAPARFILAASSAKTEKSADRMDGEMNTIDVLLLF